MKLVQRQGILIWFFLIWFPNLGRAQFLLPPSLYLPLSSATEVSQLPFFDWNEVPNAQSYEFELSRDGFASVIKLETTVSEANPAMLLRTFNTLTGGVRYEWRVRAKSADGRIGDWSRQAFTTTTAQLTWQNPTATLIAPMNGSVTVKTATDVFEWHLVPNATRYLLQITDFNDVDFRASVVLDTDRTLMPIRNITQVLSGVPYKWRVLPYNETKIGAWSEVRIFNSLTPPDSPNLIYPEDGKTDVLINSDFRWFCRNASSYILQISTNSMFDGEVGTVITKRLLKNEYLSETYLAGNTRHYWRVIAENEGGSTTSPTKSFITGFKSSPPLGEPRLLSPKNSSSDQLIQPAFEWEPVYFATRYELSITPEPNLGVAPFIAIVPSSENTLTITTQLKGYALLNGQTYKWRVRGVNDSGTGDWSQEWVFSTGRTLAAVTLLSPADLSFQSIENGLLRWERMEGATAYEVELAKDASFEPLVNTVFKPFDNLALFRELLPLQYDTSYFWRVRALNRFGNGAWSVIRSFKTVPQIPPKTQLQSPSPDATHIGLNAHLAWINTPRATSYEVEYWAKATPSLKTSIRTASLTAALKDLAPVTNYEWRVRALNLGGAGEWSDVWAFTTLLPSPQILEPTPNKIVLERSVAVRWQKQQLATQYELQVAQSPSFESATIRHTQVLTDTLFIIPDLKPHESLYIQVRAKGVTATSAWSNTAVFHAYPSQITLNAAVDFGSARHKTQYQLIGLPGSGKLKFTTTFSGRLHKDWIAYRELGAGQAYEAVTANEVIEAGRGYWAIARQGWSVQNQTVESVPLAADNTYAISLVSGWNLIANPFDLALDWALVQQVNKITGQVLAFQSGVYTPASVLEPYQGYYYYNDQNLRSLRMPYPPATPLKPKLEGVASPMLRLIAQDEAKRSSEIQVGFGSIERIQPLPSLAWSDFSLSLDVGEFGAIQWVKPYAEGYIFDLKLKASPQAPLLFLPLDLPKGWLAYLRLPENGQIWALTQAISFRPSQNETSLQLVLGTQAFIAQTQALPQTLGLLPAYPNPFQQTVALPLELPVSTRFELAVYDLLGRKIKDLAAGLWAAGRYEVKWDGRDASGKTVPNGTYFMRLQTPNTSQTQRLIRIGD